MLLLIVSLEFAFKDKILVTFITEGMDKHVFCLLVVGLKGLFTDIASPMNS